MDAPTSIDAPVDPPATQEKPADDKQIPSIPPPPSPSSAIAATASAGPPVPDGEQPVDDTASSLAKPQEATSSGPGKAADIDTALPMEVDGGDEHANEVTIKTSPAEDTWPEQQFMWEDKASKPTAQQEEAAAAAAAERPLNVGDALTYLDSVKKQFSDSPGVYNRFLDIMKDFKNQSIDTPGVIQRVSTLFAGYPQLIEGFNTFLPAGYRIECTVDADDTNVITVTTPNGTTVQTQSAEPPFQSIAGPSTTASIIEEGLHYTHEQISPAMDYVAKIKQRFAGHEELYQEFIDILNSCKRPPVDQEQLAQRIAELFRDSPDLLSGLRHFVPQDMFNALDTSVSAEREGRANKHGKKKAPAAAPVDSGALAVAASTAQKRKRKASNREKEREREREREREMESEVPTKSSQSKTKRSKHQASGHDPLYAEEHSRSPHHSHSHRAQSPASHPRAGPSTYESQPLSIPAAPVQNDALFFDRVRQTIDSREVYNEFLKLVNLFTQEIIDMRRLVEQSRSFLGEELLAQFKDILGWDFGWEGAGAGHGTNGEGMERLTKEHLSIRHGPSYRRLPASEANVPCSGRDDMCRSVLNDEWVTHPTWASEDSGFYTHKKNAYEEALHRSEEERHEYDFHIEAITRTIATLEPFHVKIMQLSPEERATSKQKMPLSGVNKAIHQRIIKKVYGREAGMEVIQTMHDSPAIAIPIVFARLKQKEEEWKKAQREWNKVWREIDARNYQKSLDHQGITFKMSDKKAITAKTFLSQIESAREEQMSRRASLIDPLFARTRPRYQMAFAIEDTDVMMDLFKLTFSLLDRMAHHISLTDRRRIEGFLRAFVPLFFMLDNVAFDNAFSSRNSQLDQQFFTDDFSHFIDEVDENVSVASSSRSGRNGRRTAGNDLRKKLLKTNANAQSKSQKTATAQNAQASEISTERVVSPVQANLMLVDDQPAAEANEGGPAPLQGQSQDLPLANLSRSRPSRRGSFFTNAGFYTLLRLFEVLYSRLYSCKDLASKLANDPSSPYRVNPMASDLALLTAEASDRRLVELQKGPSPAAHFYPYLLESCERLFDNVIDQQAFEDITRHMFGTKAYVMFTVDKVIGAIIKQVQNIISDSKSLVILEGLKREREMSAPSSIDLDEIRASTEKAIGPEENLFRIDWTPDSHTMTIQLMGKDDGSFDDYDVYTGRWQAYIDSFVSDDTTRGFSDVKIKPPFLTRNYRTVKKTPLTNQLTSRSGLEIKVCVRTYRMFFVSETEDFMYRAWSPEEIEETEKRIKERSERSRRWLTRFDEENKIPIPS